MTEDIDAVMDFITLGQIGKPHGLKGWVKIVSFTEHKDSILEYRHLMARIGDRWRKLEMDQARAQGKGLIGHFVGYDCPEVVKELVGAELAVSGGQLPELEPDDYYWHQLQGLTVVTIAGVVLGSVTRLLETGANDVLIVQATQASIDDRERLIPWLPGTVIVNVDLERKCIKVDWESDYLE